MCDKITDKLYLIDLRMLKLMDFKDPYLSYRKHIIPHDPVLTCEFSSTKYLMRLLIMTNIQ